MNAKFQTPSKGSAIRVCSVINKICENWRKQGITSEYMTMMCAGYEYGGKDACQGDSGGPLMMEENNVWFLIGIVSAGYSCAKQYQPGIYHKVSSSADWVSSAMH
ncbi:Enteropeptidase [Araneus ventricosus]|uniref:Enteropeptidase n=1 Tax=Araneus ventricosus TaxID=182803 RepID=A0A4Y2VVM3_ARAVE|nr:Enteropeptidase [Araneus ventricosus]